MAQPEETASFLEGIEFSKASWEDYRQKQTLSEFMPERYEPAQHEFVKFAKLLESAEHERQTQSFLEEHPHFLTGHLGGGHGRWVIPQMRFGSEFVADFVLGEKMSCGHYWQVVEIESPRASVFNKKGTYSQKLNEAINQITKWRAWLAQNQNYASRRIEDGGLGLLDIEPNVYGLIIIGRRHLLSPETHALRRNLMSSMRIEIRTYDHLLERGENVPMYHKFGETPQSPSEYYKRIGGVRHLRD